MMNSCPIFSCIIYVLLFMESTTGTENKEITPNDITHFSKNFSLFRRSWDQNLNEISRYLEHGSIVAFRRSQTTNNATDMILDQLDRVTIDESKQKTHEVVIKPYIIVQTFKLQATEIVGIALFNNNNNNKEVAGSAPRIEEIFTTTIPEHIMASGDFLAAVYVPKVLREQILAANVDAVVVVTVFLKDSLFIESNDEEKKTNGVVFSVLIPDFHAEFKAPIKIVYKVDRHDLVRKRCAHWLYGYQLKGAWKRENVAAYCASAAVEVCEYTHVTHFGLLITADTDANRMHKTTLDAITLVGCVLSLFGIGGIIATAILFKQWRANKGNIILTNYAVVTLLEIVLLYASGLAKESAVCDLYLRSWCYWSGILLHYVVLAQFFWVLVISFLQYKRYVEIFGDVTTNLVLKSSLVGWGLPLLIVLPVAVAFPDNYTNSHSSVCYPSGLVLFIGVLLPILIIVLINIVVFGLIVRTLFANPRVRSTMRNQTLIKFRLLLLLFFQLGISWIFGFLGNLHIALVYVFCLTATLQGFFVFLLFIIFNQPTRLLYVKLVKGSSGNGREPESSTKYANVTSSTAEATEDGARSAPISK